MFAIKETPQGGVCKGGEALARRREARYQPRSVPDGRANFPEFMSFSSDVCRGQQKHIKCFQHKHFAPTPPKNNFGAPKKVYVSHLLGKKAKKGPPQTFSGGFWGVKKAPQTGHFVPQKVYSFFPAHSLASRDSNQESGNFKALAIRTARFGSCPLSCFENCWKRSQTGAFLSQVLNTAKHTWRR